MPSDVLTTPAPRFSQSRLRETLGTLWDLHPITLTDLGSERDLNVGVDGRYVLKISNPAEDAAVVEMETAALEHLVRADPSLLVPTTIPTRTGATTATDDDGRQCLVRLITVLPGQPLERRPITVDLAEQVGAVAARVSLALAGFFHPAAGRTLDWDVRRAPDLIRTRSPDPRLLDLADRLTPAVESTRTLPGGIQHADVTLTNVLAVDDQISGVIDLGDMHHTAAVCDLAVTLTSVLRNTAPEQPADLWTLTDAVLRGYQRHRPLAAAEVDVLGELVLARLALTLVISGTRAEQHADNLAYITQYDRANARVLEALLPLSPIELAARLHRLAGTRQSAATPDLANRRAAVMGGPLAPLFYRHPLDLVRGDGPWLFDRHGRRYLDAYNNVAVVGHAHPAVANAVSRQLATLNTHSRYLHPGIIELAERLVATMPDGLDTVLFTTSGTEANEVAWRLATAWTGGDGAIVAEHAYHGSTRWMADLSSNEWPPGYRPERVATFRAPIDPDDELTEAAAVERIATAAAHLVRGNSRPALVLADAQFTSEGIHNAPASYFNGLVAGSHAAGALFLADEVQSGFGRSGPQLWRFALAGITPDIVTLGKPMGAGYPIGAVITRREIADRLAEDYEYFSTFAATPAAAAAGLAVLDILHGTGLPAAAVEVGANLRARLDDLRLAHPSIGPVRGLGLLAGVDLVPPSGAEPRPYARAILNGLAEAGVLAGLTGPRGDVLKIRPPLVWRTEHVDVLVETLNAVLGAAEDGTAV